MSQIHIQKLLNDNLTLDAKGLARRKQARQLIKKFNPYIGKTLSHDEIRKIIISVTGSDPKSKTKKVVKELFVVEESRTANLKGLKLVRKLTKKDLFRQKQVKTTKSEKRKSLIISEMTEVVLKEENCIRSLSVINEKVADISINSSEK